MEYKIFHFDSKEVVNRSSSFPEEGNEYIVETAGFIPLDVRFKQMEQNGIVASLREQDYSMSISDLRQLYFGEDTEIHQYDDFEEVEEKLYAQQVLKNNLYNEYLKKLKSADDSPNENNKTSKEVEKDNENNKTSKEEEKDKKN